MTRALFFSWAIGGMFCIFAMYFPAVAVRLWPTHRVVSVFGVVTSILAQACLLLIVAGGGL